MAYACLLLPRRVVALMLGRGVELSMDLCFAKPPRWRIRGDGLLDALFNKRFCFFVVWIKLLLLAGLGGEGEKKKGLRQLKRSAGGSSDLLSLLGFSGRPWWRGEKRGGGGDLLLLLREVVVLFVVYALAGRGGKGSSGWRWLGDGGGWPGCRRRGWKLGGSWARVLWPYSFIDLQFRRLRRTVLAAVYMMWWCSRSGGWWYGVDGDG